MAVGCILLYPSFDTHTVDLLLDAVKPRVKWHSTSDMEHQVLYISTALGAHHQEPHSDRVPVISLGDVADIERFSWLLIPDRKQYPAIGSSEYLDEALVSQIRALVERATYVVAIGSGSQVLARTCVLDELRGTLPSPQNSIVELESIDIFRSSGHGGGRIFWSTGLSNLDIVHDLGILLNYALRGDQVGSALILPSKERDAPSYYPPIIPERVAGSTGDCIFSEASRFVLLLLAEGYIEYAESVVRAILSVMPSHLGISSSGHGVEQAMEFMWSTTSVRPFIPGWKRSSPSEDELKAWDNDSICRWGDESSNMFALETYETLIKYEGIRGARCSLEQVVRLSVSSNQEAKSKYWIKQLLDYEPQKILSLATIRPLSKLLLSGYVAQCTGHTPEHAAADTAAVVQALHDWPEAEARRQVRKTVKISQISTKTIPELLDLLGPYRSTNHEPLRRTPATDSAILSAEERLNIELPDDYKVFLRASNGMEYISAIPGGNMPGLSPVDDLQWKTREELGLKELLELDEFEYDSGRVKGERGRILMLSDDSSEESLWYMEPSDADRITGEWKKRLTYWVFWSPEEIWQGSFRDYVEKFASLV